MFDIRTYNTSENGNDNVGSYKSNHIRKRYSIIKFLQDNEPIIQEECRQLVENINERTEKHFNAKIGAWKSLLEQVDILGKEYEIS